MVEASFTETSVQSGVLLAVTLWKSTVSGIITVVAVLCWIKNRASGDQRG